MTTWNLRDQPWAHGVEFTTGQPRPRLLKEFFQRTAALHSYWENPEHSSRLIERSILLRAPSPSDGLEADKAAEQLLEVCTHSVFLTLSPERMRLYSPKQADQLGAEGEHISSMLWSLCQSEQLRLEWADWLSELIAPELAHLDFIETELGDVMLTLVEGDGTRTSARALSDGTLRFLGTLVALRTAPEGSFVLLEEPETGLHPQRIHLLVEYMEAVTKERGIQVIATTHSPQLLQSLSPESRRNAVLCARVPEHPGSVLRRLGDLPHFDEVTSRSSLDHLFTTGWLERAL